MNAITTIGLDLAKKVFLVQGFDAERKVVVTRLRASRNKGLSMLHSARLQ